MQQPFAAVLVVCEGFKLVVSMVGVRLTDGSRNRVALFSCSSAYSFGVPAFFLALTNSFLGFAVPRLNPIMYQVLFKGSNVLCTACLSSCIRPLAIAQWGALLLLLIGCALTLQDAARADNALLPRDGGALPASPVAGIAATLIGSASMAIQSVWFEAQLTAPSTATDSGSPSPTASPLTPAADGVAWPMAALAAWGMLANGGILIALDAPWLVQHAGIVWHGFSSETWGVVLAIACADLSMAVFTKHLGATAYLFSRMLAMVVCAVCTVAVLHLSLSLRFAVGALIIVGSAQLYQKFELPRDVVSPRAHGTRTCTKNMLAGPAALVAFSLMSMHTVGSLGVAASAAPVPAADLDGPSSTGRARESTAPLRAARPQRMWHLTDVHLNLWHDSKGDVRDMCRSAAPTPDRQPGRFGHFNCDPTPNGVLKLALARMKEVEPRPLAILLGGDDMGHVPARYENAEAAVKSQQAVAAALGAAFPGVPVLPTLGNHDTWPYFRTGIGAVSARAELARLYGAHLGPMQRRQLSSRGYYVHRLTSRMWVAVLETNMLALPDGAADGEKQLAWLERKTDEARQAGASIVVLGHIAPGASHIDWDSMAASGWSGGGMTAAAQERLYALLRSGTTAGVAPSHPIVALLFGHLHTGSVRLLPPTAAVSQTGQMDESAVWPVPLMYLSPSLTPRNPTPHRPAVRLYEFREGQAKVPAELYDITELTFDLDGSNAARRPEWTETTLRKTHNLTSLSYESWRAWARQLQVDDAAFVRHVSAQRCADEIDSDYGMCKASYLCAVLEPEASPYAACLQRLRKSAVPPPGWKAAVKRQP